MAKTEQRALPDNGFPRLEVVEEMKKLHAYRVELIPLREAAEKKLVLARQQRGVVEAFGGEPEKVIRDRTDEVARLDRETEKAKERLFNLSRAESARFAQIRESAFAEIYQDFVRVKAAVINGLASQFTAAVDEITVLFRDPAAANEAAIYIARVRHLDTGVAAWNDLIKTLGAPGNHAIPENLALEPALRNSLRAEMLKSLKEFQSHFNRLAEIVGAEPLATERQWREPKPEPASKMRPPTDGRFWPVRLTDESNQ